MIDQTLLAATASTIPTKDKAIKTKPVAKVGRPLIYSQEIVDVICERLASGESLLQICKDEHLPCRRTVTGWLVDELHLDFLRKYKESVDNRTEHMFDDLLDIAEDKLIDTQRARLMIDTRKWYLSKIMPKKYGDKLDVTSNGNDLVPTPILNLTAVLTPNLNVLPENDSDPESNQSD